MAISRIRNIVLIIIISFSLLLLYQSSKFNYLLFHSIAELFSICIAFTVFALTLCSYKYLKNNYYIVIGIAYLFIGVLDLFHTLSYKGMAIFTDYDFYANQLWIAARYIESITLVAALLFINYKKQVNFTYLLVIYTFTTTITLLSVFVWRIFPICFVEGIGLTQFKITSEYIIMTILIVSLILLYVYRNNFIKNTLVLISISIVATILSELAFTSYASNYGFANAIGHYFKILSFYLIYVVIIKNGIREPYSIIFKEMKETELVLNQQNEKLQLLAIRDSLTGLYNHGYIYEFLIKEEIRYKRHHNSFVVIMIDVDHFKMINDTYGHVKGDQLLVEFAVLLRANLRESDIIGRYGGEEFLVVLVDSDLENGFNTAEKIRKAVENYDFLNSLSITISLGVSEYHQTSITELIDSADKKMYEAKHSGRNKTVM